MLRFFVKFLGCCLAVMFAWVWAAAWAEVDLAGGTQSVAALVDVYVNSSETPATLTVTGDALNLSNLGSTTDSTRNNILLNWAPSGDSGVVTGTAKAGVTLDFTSTVGNYITFSDASFAAGTLQINGATLATWADQTVASNVVVGAVGAGFRMGSHAQINITGNITGSGDLWFSYDGSVATLLGNNTGFSGRLVVGTTTAWWESTGSNVTVKLGSATALPTNARVGFGLERQGTLDLNGQNLTNPAFSTAGTGTVKGIVTNSNTGTQSVVTSQGALDTVQLTGNIHWNANAIANDTIFAGTHSHTGGTTYTGAAAGTRIKVGAANGLGTSAITFVNIDTLDLNGNSQALATIPQDATFTVVNTSETAGKFTYTGTAELTSAVVFGSATDAALNNFAVELSNAGTRTWSATESYHTGGTVLTNGAVVIGEGEALGGGGGKI